MCNACTLSAIARKSRTKQAVITFESIVPSARVNEVRDAVRKGGLKKIATTERKVEKRKIEKR